jgi:zinc protease
MNRLPGHILTLIAVASLSVGAATAQVDIDIRFEKFVLDNGLTLVVHEDHKAPIVAVNVWYHVGSKNEKPGKTGFAHLFEHLMFNGSENFDDDYFQALERVGATDLNGTTNEDRTNYFQNVPSSALDVALWMESDRMGHLLGAITQEKLDEQRDVVKNEKRQSEDSPYGKVFDILTENSYPAGHPYSWTVIGSMADLDAASLEDVHEWFEAYYGAANATLVVAGDVDAADVRERVQRYFGHIPAGPPLTRPEVWVAKRTQEKRLLHYDRVPQARLYMAWNVPEWGSIEADQLELVTDLLGGGKTSRLYKRLVFEDQTCTDVAVGNYVAELGSVFYLWVTAQPGGDLAQIETALRQELQQFLQEGPNKGELQRVQTQHLAGALRGSERIGGFGGKSDLLAESQVYGGTPDFYRTRLQRVQSATASQLQRTAAAWLSDGAIVVEVLPSPEYSAGDAVVDRSAVPVVDSYPAPDFPALQEARLTNGLRVLLAERHAVPTVELRLLIDAGYAADQLGAPGTAKLTLDMLDEGTRKRSSLQISEQLSLLGANLSSGSNLDMSTVSLSALTVNLDASLELFADVLLNPSFPQDQLDRLRQLQLATIQREKATPIEMALRVFPGLLYGRDHAYGLPFRGSGTEASVSALTRADLQAFHDAWMHPNNATLIVVGDITMDGITRLLEDHLSKWQAGDVPAKNIADVEHRAIPEVYLIDRPGSEQSIIFAAHVAPPRADPRDLAINSMNDILGGEFTARINMNLREDKGWAYGAYSLLLDALGQRPFLVYAPVQTDKTAESMAEIHRELTEFTHDRPPTDEELAKVKDSGTLRLPGRWETAAAVAGSMTEMVRFGLPSDYWQTYANSVRALSLQQVSDVAAHVILPERLVWVVVGDREQIEAPMQALGFGAIQMLDADGNRL